MSKEGSYYVHDTPPKDHSFRSFICALLVFLVLCIIIILALTLGTAGRDDEEVEVFRKSDTGSSKEKLTNIEVPNDTEETEPPSEEWPMTTQRSYETDISTPVSNENENAVPQYVTDSNQNSVSSTTSRYITKATTSSGKIEGYPTTESSITVSTDKTTTVDYGIDHEIFHGKSTTESTKSSNEVNYGHQSTTETTKDNEPDTKTTDFSIMAQRTTQVPSQSSVNNIQNYDSTTEAAIYFTTIKTISGTRDTNTGSTTEGTIRTTSASTTNSVPAVSNISLEQTTTFVSITNNSSLTVENDASTTIEPLTTLENEKLSTQIAVNYKSESTIETTTELENNTETTTDASTQLPSEGAVNVTHNYDLTTEAAVNFTTIETTSGEIDTTIRSTVESTTNSVPPVTFRGVDSTTESSTVGTALTSTISSVPPVSVTTLFYVTDSSIVTAGSNSSTTFEPLTSLEYEKLSTPEVTRVATTTPLTTPLSLAGKFTTLPPLEKTCITRVCKKAATTILDRMNHDADPCDNFYKFACGGTQVHEGTIKDDNFKVLLKAMTAVNSTSEKYLMDFKKFYETCVDYERTFKFTDRMRLVTEIDDTYLNLNILVPELILTQGMPFFDIGLNIKDNQEYKYQLTLPGQSPLRVGLKGWSLEEQIKHECLEEQTYSVTDDFIDLDEMHNIFMKCRKTKLNDIARSFIEDVDHYVEDRNNSIFSDENLHNLMELLDKIQTNLPSQNQILNDQLIENYKDYDIDMLQGYNIVDWKVLFSNLAFNKSYAPIKVEVYSLNYMNDMFDILMNYSESELAKMLKLYGQLQLYKNTVVPKHRENLEHHCMHLATQLMPDVVSIIIYQRANEKNTHRKNFMIRPLFDDLKTQFQESVSRSQLDTEVKDKVVGKLRRLNLGMITTGDYNVTRRHYENVNLTDRYQVNVLELLSKYRKMVYSLEASKATAASLLIYFVDPFYSKPVSFYSSNYIVVHPAVFEEGTLELPFYLRMSKIGLQLGMELAKQVDPFSISLLKFSAKEQIFFEALRKRSSDLLITYANNSYQWGEKFFTFQTEPPLLVNEMIADNAAMRLTYDFMVSSWGGNQDRLPWILDSYSKKKLFFIAAMQEYCKDPTPSNFMDDMYETFRLPSPLKIQNMVSNTPEFSNEFQCPEGSSMRCDGLLITQFPNVNMDSDNYVYDTEST